MEEIWKDVEGYEGLYQISNLGRLRSLDKCDRFGRFFSGCIIKCHSSRGYINCCLHKDGKLKRTCIHRLVAQAFIPNPNNYPVVNHKDRNPSNNCVENLEWCTQKHNVHWDGAIERRAEAQRNRSDCSKMVNQYSLEGIFIKTWPSLGEIYKCLGIPKNDISRCCKNKTYAHSYQWRFFDEYSDCANIEHYKKKNTKQVVQYDIDNNLIKTWPSGGEIQRQTGWYFSNIHKAIIGLIPTAYGYKWSYL